MYQTLIEAEELKSHSDQKDWVIIDCRFRLNDTESGYQDYLAGHIPGAIYAHLDRDLSGPPVTDSGRHPLPTPAAMTKTFSKWGIGPSTQVVAYDDVRGVYASRLWWMLRYMGHPSVAVLNGGFQAWNELEYLLRSGAEESLPGLFEGEPRYDRLVVLEDVDAQPLLVDSRSENRYLGLEEPIDPRAGHIPGAINYFYTQNFTDDGRFLDTNTLLDQWNSFFEETPAGDSTFYCGSGVSACVNLLAIAHAGLDLPKLYVGSWSEWSQDPNRPSGVK